MTQKKRKKAKAIRIKARMNGPRIPTIT